LSMGGDKRCRNRQRCRNHASDHPQTIFHGSLLRNKRNCTVEWVGVKLAGRNERIVTIS
jgi:hypothetical protein